MDVRTCRKCRRLFNYSMGEPLCPVCRQKNEEDFQRAKAYIRQRPNATVAEVSQECEVTHEQIRQWLRDERLFLTGESPQLTCDGCGTMIMTGKYCDKCKNNTINALRSIGKKEEKKIEPRANINSSNRMRFLDK